MLKELIRKDIPVITTLRKLPRVDLPLIRENDFLHAMLALTQFQALGHKHIGIVTREENGDDHYFPSKKRALLEVARSLGMVLTEDSFYYLKTPRELAAALNINRRGNDLTDPDPKIYNIASDVKHFQEFLEERPQLTGLFILATSGVITTNKLMETNPNGRLEEMALLLNLLDGVKIPPLPNGEQLALITPPREELGKYLVEMLVAHIKGGSLDDTERLIPHYIPGESMKPAP